MKKASGFVLPQSSVEVQLSVMAEPTYVVANLPYTSSSELSTPVTKAEISSTSKTDRKPLAEPYPEWRSAVHEWGIIWEIHQYGLGATFGLLALVALTSVILICFLTVWKNKEKKISVAILTFLFIFSVCRCLFLTIDAYTSKHRLPLVVSKLLWGIPQPCLMSAYTLIFIILKNAMSMPHRVSSWYTRKKAIFVMIPYFLFVLLAVLTVKFIPAYRGLIFTCQLLYVTFSLLLSCFYLIISTSLWKHFPRQIMRKHSANGMIEHEKCIRSIFIIAVAVAFGGLLLCAMQLYAMAAVYGIFSNVPYLAPWPWFVFNTVDRLLEVYLMVILYVVSVMKSTVVRRKNRVTPQLQPIDNAASRYNVPHNRQMGTTFRDYMNLVTIDGNNEFRESFPRSIREGSNSCPGLFSNQQLQSRNEQNFAKSWKIATY